MKNLETNNYTIPTSQKVKFDKIVFIDLEYLSNDRSICELAIVGVNELSKIEILFHELINPISVRNDDFKVNQHVYRKIKIPLSFLKNKESLDYFKKDILSIINNKTIYHWGGSDPKILAYNLGLDIDKINKEDYMCSFKEKKQMKLIDKFDSIFSDYQFLKEIKLGLHSAAVDAILLACIYKKTNNELFNIDEILSNLLIAKIDEKTKITEEFNLQYRAMKKNENGPLAEENYFIYFTEFNQSEKAELSDKYNKMGYNITTGSSKKLNYLITPNESSKGNSRNVAFAKRKFAMDNNISIVTLKEFEEIHDNKVNSKKKAS